MTESSEYLSARDYLVQSSLGEKFVYKDLYFSPGYDDGPFGNDEYDGIPRLDLDIPDDIRDQLTLVKMRDELGVNLNLAGIFGQLPLPLKLHFKENELNPLIEESSFTWANMLLVATPRDPLGPFTVSVYQDWSLKGWLIGPDAEDLAIYLVDNCDYGCAVVPYEAFELEDEQLVLNYLLPTTYRVDTLRLRNTFTSKSLVSPSKLKWEFEPEFLGLPRNISWEGPGEHLVIVENAEVASGVSSPDDIDPVYSPDIFFVPDVWEANSSKVLVFIGDVYVGRFVDSEVETRFFDELTRFDHKVGFVNKSYKGTLFQDSKDGRHYLSVDADVREVIRVDWDLAFSDLKNV